MRPTRPLIAALALGCGPSFQAIYEGDARFEHCYALEDTQSASMQQKAECWRDWTVRHTYGQTRDRVEYAASRYHALVSPVLPTDEAMMQAAPGMVDTSAQLAAPTPTSAFEPPPVTTAAPTATVSAAPAASAAPPPKKPRAGACVAECDGAFDSCSSAPSADGAKCDAAYARCIGACAKAK